MKRLVLCFILTMVLTGCSSQFETEQTIKDELALKEIQLENFKTRIERLENENSQLKFQLETQSFSNERFFEIDDEEIQSLAGILNKTDIDRILARFVQHYDEFREITTYKDTTSVESNNENALYSYIGVSKSGEVWLRLKLQYSGEDWIFAERYTIKTDSNNYTIVPEYYDMVRHHDVDGIWEQSDMEVEDDQVNMLYDIMNSNNTTVKYEGKSKSFEYTVTSQEKFALQNILLAYNTIYTLQQ